MNHPSLLPLAVGIVLFTACSSSSDMQGTPSDRNTDDQSSLAKAPTCGSATHISSTSDFIAEVNKLDWQRASLSQPAILTLSDDLIADADLEIDASLLVGPAECPTVATDTDPLSWCNTPLFHESPFGSGASHVVPGVSCKVVATSPRGVTPCARIFIAEGTTFRLRAVVQDMHPYEPVYWPFIEFERACAAACDTGETRCEATQTCLSAGFATCAYCEGQTAQVCACRDENGIKADASECFYDLSPDEEASGQCNAGTCVGAR